MVKSRLAQKLNTNYYNNRTILASNNLIVSGSSVEIPFVYQDSCRKGVYKSSKYNIGFIAKDGFISRPIHAKTKA